MLFEYVLKTKKQGLYNITENIKKAVSDSGIKSGIVVVHCPHTTAGITINENADPDVQRDIILGLDCAFPDRDEFRHSEGNSAAHLKSSTVNSQQTIIISNGRLVLGIWQGIYFTEFDGPRARHYFVKVVSD